MELGDRVKLSRRGLHHFRFMKGWGSHMGGLIVGESHDKHCWRVVWDHRKTPDAIHKKFLTTETNHTISSTERADQDRWGDAE